MSSDGATVSAAPAAVHRPGAEAELRHLDTVGQGEQGSWRDFHENLEKRGTTGLPHSGSYGHPGKHASADPSGVAPPQVMRTEAWPRNGKLAGGLRVPSPPCGITPRAVPRETALAFSWLSAAPSVSRFRSSGTLAISARSVLHRLCLLEQACEGSGAPHRHRLVAATRTAPATLPIAQVVAEGEGRAGRLVAHRCALPLPPSTLLSRPPISRRPNCRRTGSVRPTPAAARKS